MTRIALALALAVAGCAGSRRTPEPAPEPKPAASVASAPVTALPSAAALSVSDAGADVELSRPTLSRKLELKEPGKEPRRNLRHAFTKGSRQKLRVQVVTRLVEQDRTVAASGIDAPLEVTILEVGADGSADFGYVLGPIVASSAGGAPLAISGDGGKPQLRGTATIAANGEVRDYRSDPPVPEDAPEVELLKSLFSSVIELPSEAVGAGGRWELVLEAQSSEIAIARTTSYEIAAFAGPSIKIRLSQSEVLRVPDAGGPNALTTAPSAGEWQAQLGRVFPVGRQAMKAGILTNLRGELFTEIRLIQR